MPFDVAALIILLDYASDMPDDAMPHIIIIMLSAMLADTLLSCHYFLSYLRRHR